MPIEDFDQAIHVKMENFIRLDDGKIKIQTSGSGQILPPFNHIQLLHKENWDGKGKFKSICEGDLVLWMLKTINIKGGKFKLPQKGSYKMHKTFNNNTIKLITLGDDEVVRININKLKEYHSKSVVANIMATNVHVKRYPNGYYQGKTLIVVPKNSFMLVSKPRRLPWTYFILKIVDDEYFWT